MDTLGNLIDKLTICNIRIWMAEDLKRSGKDEDIIKGTKITNVANVHRNKLIEEIDNLTGQQSFGQGSTKLYGK